MAAKKVTKKKATPWWNTFQYQYGLCSIPKWVKTHPGAAAAWAAGLKAGGKQAVDVYRFASNVYDENGAAGNSRRARVRLLGVQVTVKEAMDFCFEAPMTALAAALFVQAFPTYQSFQPYMIEAMDVEEPDCVGG